jgi:AcrR family transcriptional regulator
MPKVSDAYLETRRQQVLDAAYACFARKGFHETTMQDIAREAGVSYGVVYHYFDGKEDVIEAVWQASRQARSVRYQAAQQKDTAPEILAEFLDLSLKRLEMPEFDPEMRFRIQLFGETLRNPRLGEQVRAVWDDVMEMLEDAICLGQERGEINPGVDPRALARAYLAVHDGLVLQKTIDPDVDVWKLTEIFWAMHRGELWLNQGTGADNHEDIK